MSEIVTEETGSTVYMTGPAGIAVDTTNLFERADHCINIVDSRDYFNSVNCHLSFSIISTNSTFSSRYCVSSSKSVAWNSWC